MIARALLVALLGLAVLGSAATLILARHASRQAFVELKSLERTRDGLEEEWARLQLEQATWGANGRVEEIARQRLDMDQPASDQVVLVRW